ncbi:hypothetical protein [Paucibacter sp. KBW04]|nr:hypothetical protein [Paucibacter sp. KBW04]
MGPLTLAGLLEFAELFVCWMDKLLLEASTRNTDPDAIEAQLAELSPAH